MDLILFTLGSSGDVHPFVGIGKAMKARGHHVTLVTNGYFRPLVESAGLEFVEHGTAEQYLELLNTPELWDNMRGFGYIVRNILVPSIRPTYDILKDRYVPGKTVVAASTLALGARVAQEKLGMPLASVHLSPVILRSVVTPGVLPGLNLRPWTPHWYRRFMYWLADTLMIDRMIKPELNGFRRELGLAPVSGILKDWFHSPDMVLGMFPEWFAPRAEDWPSQLVYGGFPLFDGKGHEEVPGDPAAFLAEGRGVADAPIVFTAGTGMKVGHVFFRESAAACALLNRRGMLLTRYGEQIPAKLPKGVRHFEYIPFSIVLPRAAAIVHHGGIGTTSQSLAAGIPQLIMPMSHDQPDNADRIARLGVGTSVLPTDYKAARVAEVLSGLLGTPSVGEKAREIARRMEKEKALEAVCMALDGLEKRVKLQR